LTAPAASPVPSDAEATAFQLWLRGVLGGVVLSNYLRLIAATSRLVREPADQWEIVQHDWPVIAVSWHGQSNLAYAYTPERGRWSLLISTHPDGRIAAALARSFGFGVVDGSGMSERQKHGTGGLAAFRGLLKALRSGQSLFLTADVPPIPGRAISPGIIALARHSGRPVYAVATSSSRRRVLERVWDRMQFNFPFSRAAFVLSEPVWMTDPAVNDETYAALLRERLDSALARANDIADGRS
jgi:lysophospholipid acyltransferase (LPLAT)-like uncharacterized protein